MDAEEESVQTAMNAMMAEKSITAVTASTSGQPSINSWSALPTDIGTSPLSGYLQSSTTVYYYCWNGSGQITAQNKTNATVNSIVTFAL